MPIQTLPVARLPAALTGAERDRSQALRRALAGATTAVHERPGGYAFELAARGETLRNVAEWIELERRRCPSLTFRLQWYQGAERPELVVTGPPGTKELLHAAFPELGWERD